MSNENTVFLIEKKKKELAKWYNFKTKNMIGFYIFELILAIAFLVMGFVFMESFYSGFLSILLLILGVVLLFSNIPLFCIYCSRRKNAPMMYDKIYEEIKILEAQLYGNLETTFEQANTLDKPTPSIDNEELSKLDKMLDAGVISRSEYEDKKSKINMK